MATDPDDETSDEGDTGGETRDEEPAEYETDAGESADDATGVEYDVNSDDRTWGILTHASGLTGLVVPFGNILVPLIIWLVKRDESQFVDENGKEVLNFQITWTVLLVVSGLTILVGVGLLLFPLVGLAWLILVVLGTVRASEEQVYDYPLTVDLIS